MHHVFDDDDSRATQAQALGIDAVVLRRAAATLVVWMFERKWLTASARTRRALQRFQVGEVGADDVYKTIGHRLTTRRVEPHRLYACEQLFGVMLIVGEGFRLLVQRFGDQLETLPAERRGLEDFFAELDRAHGVDDGSDTSPVPLLVQLSQLAPVNGYYATLQLHAMGYALAVALDQEATTYTVGVDLDLAADGRPVHHVYVGTQMAQGSIFARPVQGGGVRVTHRAHGNLVLWTDGEQLVIEMSRLSNNDRAECERLAREGMALFSAD